MSEGFIQQSRDEEKLYLLRYHPNAFLLLTLIADRARRYAGGPDGLLPGQCYIGDYEACGLTEQKYRTAKELLKVRKHILICETCRTRQKSTTGTTTIGTLVKLISTNVYDINLVPCNDRPNDRATTGQRPTNDEQRKKQCKESKQQQQEVAAVSFYGCLEENKILTKEEKLSLMQYPEPRVIAAFAYANSVKIKKTLISTLIWHCQKTDVLPPEIKKQDIRKEVRKRFPNGSEHNGATCFHAPGKIRFERGITGLDLDDKEADYKDKLNKILETFNIQGLYT